MRGNHKTFALFGATALALTISACQQVKPREAAKVDVAAIKDAIAADEKAWNEHFRAKNLEGILSHYSSDAYMLAPGMKGASGSADIRKTYEGAISDPNFDVSFASDKVDVAGSGDLAYSRGHFTEKYTDQATKQAKTDSGAYVTVYKKQSDGSWKAVEDFTAVEPAAAPAG